MSKPDFDFAKDNNKIIFSIAPSIYPLDVVYGACYSFLEKAYLFLDGDPENEIEVHLKGKEKLSEGELESLAREFMNELINVALKYRISRQNEEIREYIVSTVLLGSSEDLREGFRESELTKEAGAGEEWEEDPMDIAIPWEEKHETKDQEDDKS